MTTGRGITSARQAAVEPTIIDPRPSSLPAHGSVLSELLRTTDHKVIGRMYMVTSFAFFMLGGCWRC